MTDPAAAGAEDGRPLHRRILAEIRGRILSGQWPPGTQIPFEQDLAVRFGCSRMTVNKVMTQLVAAGLIERRRRAGSFVRRPQSQSAVMEIVDIRREVEVLGLLYGFTLLSRESRRSTSGDAARLGLKAPAPVLHIACLHVAAHQPFCLEDRLIDLGTVPEAAAADFGELSPGAWLMTRVPWTTAEHRIRAVGAEEAGAAALSIGTGTPCLEIERRTFAGDVPVTSVRFLYPGKGHEVVARFTPSGA